MTLKGKTAIVTGAGSGIGKAAAGVFAQEGANVVVVDWNRENGEQTAASIRKTGHEAVYCYADVSNAQDVEAMVNTAVGRYGTLDVIFNNAAIQVLAKLVDTTED